MNKTVQYKKNIKVQKTVPYRSNRKTDPLIEVIIVPKVDKKNYLALIIF